MTSATFAQHLHTVSIEMAACALEANALAHMWASAFTTPGIEGSIPGEANLYAERLLRAVWRDCLIAQQRSQPHHLQEAKVSQSRATHYVWDNVYILGIHWDSRPSLVPTWAKYGLTPLVQIATDAAGTRFAYVPERAWVYLAICLTPEPQDPEGVVLSAFRFHDGNPSPLLAITAKEASRALTRRSKKVVHTPNNTPHPSKNVGTLHRKIDGQI